MFHKVKFGVRKAFFICFKMATTTKILSASYVAERFSVTEKIGSLFMHKVCEAMKSSGKHPIKDKIHIDEFVIGGKEEGKVKRMYAMGIDNYSAKESKKLFEKHISEEAEVTTESWKGYRPIISFRLKETVVST